MNTIKYYSTNRDISVSSGIDPFGETISFKDALFMGQAPDEGLFMPDRIPFLTLNSVMELKGAPFSQAALLVGSLFLEGEIPQDELFKIVCNSYDFSVPIEKAYGRKYIMRLDQGPTASFKDFAARMMARLMSHGRNRGSRLNVLVATSGDTGSAVGHAFRNVPGISVYILYPSQEVSNRQEKQLNTIGANVQTISVDGKFDDCQNLVKQAFSDPELADRNLTSANSINFGRILPQIIYYVYAFAQLAEKKEEIVFSIPSGNFGNALGCEFARRMGLPVKKIIMATNENDEFPRYLRTGQYKKISPSRACLSNAMNVGHPSNLARFFDLYGGTVDRAGVVHKYPDINLMRQHIYSVSVTDEETKDTIRNMYNNYGILLEPHGAVGWRGLLSYLDEFGDHDLCVSLETAHPAKFPDEIKEVLNITPDLPPSMQNIDGMTGTSLSLPAEYNIFKGYLLKNLLTRE